MNKPCDNVVLFDNSENAVADAMGPAINHVIFNELLEFQLKNNPALAGKTKHDVAEACYLSETTLKNLCNGKNSNPRVGTLKCILKYIGGGSIDRMVGLAPPRDFRKEEAQYDADLVKSIQIQLDEKRSRIAELENQLGTVEKDRDRLRSLVLEKSEALAEAKTRIANSEQIIAEKNLRHDDDVNAHKEIMAELKTERIRNKRLVFLFVSLAVALVGIIALYVWDASNLHKGLTTLLN